VVENKSLMVRGFQHQTFKCAKCHETDQRFAFNKLAAPPIAPSIVEPDGDDFDEDIR
jgi:hypothetical protein